MDSNYQMLKKSLNNGFKLSNVKQHDKTDSKHETSNSWKRRFKLSMQNNQMSTTKTQRVKLKCFKSMSDVRQWDKRIENILSYITLGGLCRRFIL